MSRLLIFLYAFLVLIAFSKEGFTADSGDISYVNILADKALAASLSELASEYTQHNMVTVTGSFGPSENQEHRIEDGENTDIFITANYPQLMNLKAKKLVDGGDIVRVASDKDTHFTAALVMNENIDISRGFLNYLKSDAARKIFKKYGLNAP